jgi:hypothetical protein
VTWPESAAVSEASAATRRRAVPRLCRRSTFAGEDDPPSAHRSHL